MWRAEKSQGSEADFGPSPQVAKVIRLRSPPGEGEVMQREERPFPGVAKDTFSGATAPAAICLPNK